MAETVQPQSYTVAEVNGYLREYLAEDEFLANILVRGELSSFKHHSSGHIYFTLTEGGCSISGALFKNQAANLQFTPQAGMAVVVWGSIGYYERDGRLQLYARTFLPLGAGAAGTAFDALKQQLYEEGLFDLERKKMPPLLPPSIGVITAAGSAAWADIQKVAYGRWPRVKLKLYAATVQGDQAPASICTALAKADAAGHGVLILGRGGGAQEDLAAFNAESVARAVAAAQTPLISAVGHEIDTTLADLAADLRAATPSHAAILAVPVAAELAAQLQGASERLLQAARRRLAEQRSRLARLEQRPWLQSPLSLVQRPQLRLSQAGQRLLQAAERQQRDLRQHLGLAAARLHALSPLATLGRGYAVCRDEAGQVLKRAAETEIGAAVQVLLAEGQLDCRVEKLGLAAVAPRELEEE